MKEWLRFKVSQSSTSTSKQTVMMKPNLRLNQSISHILNLLVKEKNLRIHQLYRVLWILLTKLLHLIYKSLLKSTMLTCLNLITLSRLKETVKNILQLSSQHLTHPKYLKEALLVFLQSSRNDEKAFTYMLGLFPDKFLIL